MVLADEVRGPDRERTRLSAMLLFGLQLVLVLGWLRQGRSRSRLACESS